MHAGDMLRVHQSSVRKREDIKHADDGNRSGIQVCNTNTNPVTTLSDDKRAAKSQQPTGVSLNQTWVGHQTPHQPTATGSVLCRDTGSASLLGGYPTNLTASHVHSGDTGARPKVRRGSDTGKERPGSFGRKDEDSFCVNLTVQDSRTSKNVSIDCDIDIYMKWQYILRSPRMIYKINGLLNAQDKGQLTMNSTLETSSNPAESFLTKEELKKLVDDIIEHFCNALTVEFVYVQEGKASCIAEKINTSPFVNSTHVLYAEATNNSRVQLVYIKANEAQLIEQIEGLCPTSSLQVRMPPVWIKMSKRMKLVNRIERSFQDVCITLIDRIQDGDFICEISGRLSQVKKAEHKVIFYRDKLQCKKVKLTNNMQRACVELKLCDMLQAKIDRSLSDKCLVQISECNTHVSFNAFDEKDIDEGISFMIIYLSEKLFPWNTKLRSIPFEELKQNLLDNSRDGILVFADPVGLVLVGLTEAVTEATHLLEHMAATDKGNSNDYFSEKCFIHDVELLDILMLLAETIAKINNVKLVTSETRDEHVLEFFGAKIHVVKALKEFDDAKMDLSKEQVFVDKGFVRSNYGAEFLHKLHLDYQVKVLQEELVEVPEQLKYIGSKPTRAKLDVQGDRFIWSFPSSGKKLILDLLDIKDCKEPDLLIVMTALKPTTSAAISKATGHGNKQKKVEVSVLKWQEEKRDVKKLHDSLRRVLSKANEDGYNSVGLSLEPVGDWPFLAFMKELLIPVVKHVQKIVDKPDFINLCAGSMDKLKKTEALIRANIDPDFVENNIQTVVVSGELNEFEADVLVNTTSPTLDLTFGSVSAAIAKSAGPGLQKECTKSYPKGVRGSTVAVTGGHDLKCQHVFHGALRNYNSSIRVECLMELRTFLKNCLEKANELKVSSIAFPVIGSGNLRYPVKEVASEMFTSIERLKQEDTDVSLRFVYFVVYHKDTETHKIFRKVQKDMVRYPQTASNQSKEIKHATSQKPVSIKVIGKVRDTRKAVEALRKETELQYQMDDSAGLADQNVTQYISNISSNQYGVLLKVFPGKFEVIRDSGISVKCEENRVKVLGKLSKVTEAIKEIQAMDKEVSDIFKSHVSVRDTDPSTVESDIRKVTRTDTELLVMHDKILSMVNIYGKVPEDVNKAGKAFGYNAGISDKTERKKQQQNEDNAANTSGLYKPAVQRAFSWNDMSRNLRVFQVGPMLVKVYEGDLLESPADCIVNDANADLVHAGGLASVIAKEAGDDLRKQCYQISQRGPLGVGSVVETTAGRLSHQYKYILHTVGPRWFDYKPITKDSLSKCQQDLYTAILNTFSRAEDLKMVSVALPAISTAIFRVPREICAMQYARAILEFFKRIPSSLKEIYFVDQDGKTVSVIQDAFKCMLMKDRPYQVNLAVYYDSQLKPSSKSKQRDKTENDEMRGNDSLGSGGMVLVQPFYTIDKGKMSCVFTTCHELRIFTGNILEQNGIDAIVCSEDKSWSAGEMVAKRLLELGGKEYANAKHRAGKNDPPPDIGDVVITIGGRNKYPWVIHALIPNRKPPEALKDLLEDIFERCAKVGFKTTVMSLLGSGSGRADPVWCSNLLLTAYENFCVRNPGYKFTLYLVNIDKEKTQVLQNVFKEHIDKQSPLREQQPMATGLTSTTPKQSDMSTSRYTEQVSVRGDESFGLKIGNNETIRNVPVSKGKGSAVQEGLAMSSKDHLSIEISGRRDHSGSLKHDQQTSKGKGSAVQEGLAMSSKDHLSIEISGRRDHSWSLKHDQQTSKGKGSAVQEGLAMSSKDHLSIEISGRRDHSWSLKHDQQTSKWTEQPRQLPKEEKGADGDQTVDNCVICMDTLDNQKTLKCGHVFCTDCIEQYFKVKEACPTCFTVCGVITGDQPDGDVEIQVLKTSVAGYENCGSIGVSYRFGSGKQGPDHPYPGAWYKGINRTAYLPNTDEGRKICAMLKVAFERRLVFTIGTSRTTGQDGVITWNDIHHKTDHRPNTQFDYPDDTYLTRVKEDLAAKGVTEEDIDKQFVKELQNDKYFRKLFTVNS